MYYVHSFVDTASIHHYGMHWQPGSRPVLNAFRKQITRGLIKALSINVAKQPRQNHRSEVLTALRYSALEKRGHRVRTRR